MQTSRMHYLRLAAAICLLHPSIVLCGQIPNGDFEIWETYNGGWERPQNWQCEGVTSSIISCQQVVLAPGNIAVRVHNVLPCIDAQSDSDFRTGGRVFGQFQAPHPDFTFSYRVIIDSLEALATFSVSLSVGNPMPGAGSTALYDVGHNTLKDDTVTAAIYGAPMNVPINIILTALGHFNEDATSSCRRGYISAVVDDVRVGLISSSEAPHEASGLRLYPNPFKDALHIAPESYPHTTQVSLHDPTGRLLATSLAQREHRFDTESLPPGLYYVVIVAPDGGKVVRRAIKAGW